MINYDEARREIYSEMNDWDYLAYVVKDPIAMKEMERLHVCLNQLYIDAKKRPLGMGNPRLKKDRKTPVFFYCGRGYYLD